MKFMRVVAIVLALLVAGTLSAGCTVNKSFPYFSQCDSRWSTDKLGTLTICQKGSLMCSVASGMAGLGMLIYDQPVTPQNLNSFLMQNGGYNSDNLYVWSTVERFGLRYEGQTSDKSQIKKNICDNKLVFLQINYVQWVLAKGYDNDTFYVNDPVSKKSTFSSISVTRAAAYAVL